MTKTEALLIRLMEECAELQQATAKALEFGLTSDNFGALPLTNGEQMNAELDDILAIAGMLNDAGVVFATNFPNQKRIEEKQKRVTAMLKKLK